MCDSLNLTLLDRLCEAHLASGPTGAGAAVGAGAAAGGAAAAFENPAGARAQADAVARVHACFQRGDVERGCAAANELAPGSLDDPRFQLDLRLHGLVERVALAAGKKAAGGGDGAYEDALRYAREELAPFAQEAFPEAYRLFVEECLVFVFPERAKGLEVRRRLIADVAAATLAAHCGVKGSQLSFLVRYLAVLHCGKGSMYANVVPGHEETKPSVATESLKALAGDGARASENGGSAFEVAHGNDVELRLGPRPLEHASFERGYRDAELLALSDRFPSLGREDAIDTMRHAGGDADTALLLELARVRLDDAALDELVREYLSLRGLGNGSDDIGEGGEGWGFSGASDDGGARGAVMRSLRKVARDGSATRLVEAATRVEPDLLGSSPALRFRIGQAALVEDLRAGENAGAIATLRDKLGPLAVAHPELMPALRETAVLLAFPVDLGKTSGRAEVEAGGDKMEEDEGECAPALPVKKRRTGGGNAEHAGDDATASGGKAFVQEDPGGSNGDAHGAASGVSGAPKDEDTSDADLASIRASVLARSATSALAAPILRAVSRRGAPPRLAVLLAHLLDTHANWLVAAAGASRDRFGGLLGLDRLRSGDEEARGEAIAAAGQSGGAGADATAAADEASDEADAAREAKIMTVREFLSMSRAAAIAVLDEHPERDVSAIIELVMGG